MGTGHIGIILLVISVTLFSAVFGATVFYQNGAFTEDGIKWCEENEPLYETLGEAQWLEHHNHSIEARICANLINDYFWDYQGEDRVEKLIERSRYYSDLEIAESQEESSSEISVTTKNSYTEGELIVVSGEVSTIVEGAPVSLHILRQGNLVDISQVVVANDGTFTSTFKATGPLWTQDGTYIVRAEYGPTVVEINFDFFTSDAVEETTDAYEVDVGSHGTFDVDYSIRGATVQSMKVDTSEIELKIIISSTEDGSLTLEIPRNAFDTKKSDGTDDDFFIIIDGDFAPFVETSTNSQYRILKIDFEEGDDEIEIFGTKIFDSSYGETEPEVIEEPETTGGGFFDEESCPDCDGGTSTESTSIEVWTDSSSYDKGEFIKVFGKVDNFVPNVDVGLVVVSPPPSNNIVAIEQILVASDGTFSTSLAITGQSWEYDGVFTIKVTYGNQNNNDRVLVQITGTQSGGPLDVPVIVYTDKSSYNERDTIKVFGEVRELLSGFPITLQIIATNGNVVVLANLEVGLDKKFDVEVSSGGPLWRSTGDYIVRVEYGTESRTAQTTFQYGSGFPPDPSSSITVTTDRSSYEKGDIIVVSGEVDNPQDYDVVLRVTNPRNVPVYQQNLGLKSDGSFSDMIIAGDDPHWTDGTYVVKATHNSKSTTATFLFGDSSTSPPPSSDVSISIDTDRSLYDPGDIVNLSVNLSGVSTSQNVAISVTDPSGQVIVTRTLTTDSSGHASAEFGIHENYNTGTYTTAATVSVSGITYKDTSIFKIGSQSNQIQILSVQGTDQQGNPSSFDRGDLGFVKVIVSAENPITTLVTVNLFDSQFTTIGIASFRTTLSPGESEMVLSFMIPEDAAVGTANIYTNTFSDWPSNGGVPQTREVSAQVRIT